MLYVLLTVHIGIIFVNNQLDAQFFMYVDFYSLHVSGNHVLIIRRIDYINTTSGTCHSVQMTVWCADLDESGSAGLGWEYNSHPNPAEPVQSILLMMGTWLPETCRE